MKGIQITLLDLNGFYDILDLDFKNTWTNILDSDLVYYNQAGMLLESVKILELSRKQLVMHSSLASLTSLGQTMCGL